MKSKLFFATLLYITCQLPINGSTIFSFDQNETVFVGNNEDGCSPNPKYRIIPGTHENYGKIIFSFDNNWGQGGMNEKGLFFDWIYQSDEESTWQEDPLKKNYLGNLSEKILADCASVDEALAYYEEYNEPGFESSLIVLVDTSGLSAFVMWDNKELSIQKCQGRCVWGRGGNSIVDKLKSIDGFIDQKQMPELLNVAHQEGQYPTLYSNIYDLKKGLISLFYYHNFEEQVVIDLNEELKKGQHSVELKDIFKTQIPKEDLERLQRQHLKDEIQSVRYSVWLDILSIATLIGLILCFVYFDWRKRRLRHPD